MATHHHQHHAPTPVLVEAPGPHTDRKLDGTGLTIALISTRWYGKDIVDPLVAACKAELLHKGVSADSIVTLRVPGAFELPFAAARAIQTNKQRLDAVICIGCMVKGATMAYEFVSGAVVMGLMKLNVMTDTPVVNGILTCLTEADAKQCAASMDAWIVGEAASTNGLGSPSTTRCTHGVAWAQQALELALLKRSTAPLIEKKCQCACHCRQCKCKSCTCPRGACQCSSCFSHHAEEKKELQGLVQCFDKALKGEHLRAKKRSSGSAMPDSEGKTSTASRPTTIHLPATSSMPMP